MQAILHLKIKRILCWILLLVLCIPLPVAAAGKNEKTESTVLLKGMELAAREDTICLYYSKKKARIVIQDQKNGYCWDSAMQSKIKGTTDIQKQEMQSLLQLTYTAMNSLSSKTTSSSLESMKYRLDIKKIEDGFAYVISLPKQDMKIQVNFVLDSYGLKVTIPENGIKETVSSKEKIKEYQKEIKDQLHDMKKEFQEIKTDSDVPDDLKKNVKTSIKKLETIQEMVNSIKNAYGIKDAGDKISDEIEKIDKQMLGTSGNNGFFAQLLLSDKVSDETKNKYRSYTQSVKDQELGLKIQIANMQELSASALVSVDLMPYFGAADDKSDGYMLYPDGCGALTYFKEKHGVFQSCYEADTYSSLSPDIDWEESKESAGLYNQAIPYFGIKNGENGCIAYICEGQEMSKVKFSPSGYILPINRIGAGFTYRQLVTTSSVNGQWQSGADTQVFQQNREKIDMSVEYQFLEGAQANYSGMAGVLRNYMEDQKILKQSALVKQKTLPLAIDLFGTYKENVLIFKKSVTGTTMAQAMDMIGQLQNVPVLCNYKGVYKEGYGVYPSSYKLNSATGTKTQIQKLAKKVKKTGGKLFLESNQLLADYDQKGYQEGNLAIGNQYQVLKNDETDENIQYLLTPEIVKEKFDETVLPAMCTYGKIGVTETMMGDFLYEDYGKQHSSNRKKTLETWEKILKKAKKNTQGVSVENGSDYTFASADWLRNVPTDTSGYIYTDEAVPFYSMLVHGRIACTSTPVNQFYNEKEQVLKAIEYGLLPYYSLTAEDIDLGSTDIYASCFSDIKKEMQKTYEKYKKALEGLTDVAIKYHEKKGEKAIVQYEDGTELFINYSKKSLKIKGITVDGLDVKRVKNNEVAEDETKDSLSTISEKSNEVKKTGGQSRISVYSPLVIGVFSVLFISIAVFGSISFFKYHRS